MKWNEDEEITRREALIQSGKIGLAGLSTVLFLELMGTKNIIRKLSQKDPNAFLAGIDFEAYKFKTKISLPGKKDINMENWQERFHPKFGPYLATINRKDFSGHTNTILEWVREMSVNAFSFRPYYGGLVRRFIRYIDEKKFEDNTGYNNYIRKFIEKNGETDLDELKEIGNDRNFVLRFSGDSKDYSFLKGHVKSPLDYLLEKTAYQCAEFKRVMIELEAPHKSKLEKHKKRLDLLKKINKESFGKKYDVIVSLNEDHSYNQGKKLWEPEMSKMYWDNENVNAVTITDVSSSIKQLNYSIEKFKEAIHPKRLYVRLVIGQDRVKAGFKDGVLDLEKRIWTVKNSVAKAVFVNDVNGLWTFSGKGNPLDYKRRERMITQTYKGFFGLGSEEDYREQPDLSSDRDESDEIITPGIL